MRPGFAVDSIAIGGVVDNATNPAAWTLGGFRQIAGGQFTDTFFHYYLVESRSYVRNDTSLCGAYNFLGGNFLEKQCYADGVLVWYRNTSIPDNNTSEHPGFGRSCRSMRIRRQATARTGGRSGTRAGRAGTRPSVSTPTRSRCAQWLNGGRVLRQSYAALAVPSFFDSSENAYWIRPFRGRR